MIFNVCMIPLAFCFIAVSAIKIDSLVYLLVVLNIHATCY